MRRIFVLGFAVMLNACGVESALMTSDLHFEQTFKAHYLDLATGTEPQNDRHAWPFPLLSIGHSMASYQNYGGSPYFHHGLDIRGDAGTPVRASAGGRVVNIENYVPGNPAYWEVAILDDQGFLWQYHHIDRGSIPRRIWDAYRSGDPIPSGTVIGDIYYWSVVTFGERFHHVHLNVLGAGGRYLNPFAFLEPLPDNEPPKIVDIALLRNRRKVDGTSISGRYSIMAKVHDLILHDRFVVPAYEVSYSIDGAPAQIAWRFDGLPGGASNERYVSDFFVPTETCGNYRCRELAIDLGFTVEGQQFFTQAAGSHTIDITAKDFAGNSTTRQFQWRVR